VTLNNDQRARPPAPARDGPSIDRLFRAEAPRLQRFIRSLVYNRDDAQDLVQDTFVKFVGSAPPSALGNPAAYLTTIARHLLFKRSKKRVAQHRIRHVPMNEARDVSTGPDQEWMMEAADIIRKYEQALAELPARTREIFRLNCQEELSYDEIAAQLGINRRVVKYHLRKALIYLDRRVNDDV